MITAFREIITDNIRYFSRVIRVAWLFFKKKNATSDLGWVWNVIKPVMYMLMFYAGISLGFKNSKNIDGTVCPYFIWLISGMVAWFYISDHIAGGPNCYKTNKTLVTKGRYPVTVIPTVAVINNLYLHVILVGVVLCLAMLFGVKPSIYWLQIPVLTCMIMIFIYLWSFLFGMLTIVSADTLNLIKSIKPAFFWLSGILFNSRARDSIVFKLNPITYLVEGYRSSIAYNMCFWYSWKTTACFFGELLIMAVISAVLYKRLKYKLVETLVGV